jgi:superfamily II DNA or RNA helicase
MRSKLRPYQREALEWALRVAEARGGAVVSLPTGTGKTLVAVAFAERYAQRGARVLVLEPTRFLVEQTARKFRYEGLDASMVHSGVRERDWSRRVVVATPESALSYLQQRYGEGGDASSEFPVVIVDECHHTVGRDPFAQVMRYLEHSVKLGLSALVPKSRAWEIERYIGPIRRWDFSELEGKGYEKPYMIAEVYEAPFRREEEELYERLYEVWLSGGPDSHFAALALTTLSRDGSDALLDSAARPTAFANFLQAIAPLAPIPPEPHKLPVLESVLADYEGNFEKAIVFVNRRCTADLLAERFKELNPVKIVGGRGAADPEARRSALEEARRPEAKLIIATSAGDEGIDIPEVDLLIFWSHVSSPLRLYQRLGRGLRPAPDKIKYTVFIVTPGTRDYDALPESLVALAREGIDVSGIFDEVSSQVLGEGLLMARKVKELAESLGARGVSGEVIISALAGARGLRAYRRVARELDESVRVGALLPYYDVSEVYAELQSWVEAGAPEAYVRLGAGHRRFIPVEEAEEGARASPESFADATPCFDPLNDLKVKGASEGAAHRLRVELLRLLASSAKPRDFAEAIRLLALENPAAMVKWRFRVEAALIPVDGREVRLTLAADYGPFMAKNAKQIEFALKNTAALWNLVLSLASGSEGLGHCDRLLRARAGILAGGRPSSP